MLKTSFKISKMDCPSEENLIKMKLSDFNTISHLEFDLHKRILVIYHNDDLTRIKSAINDLNLDERMLDSVETEQNLFKEDKNQKKLLISVLIINLFFFVTEMGFGFFSSSMGLVADSLDMLADSFVYGISLLAVGSTVIKKKQIALIAGYFQILLAIIGFIEVLRRFFETDETPNYLIMIIVSIFALIGNGICLLLLQKSKSKDQAHMKASLIFTSNDVIINLGIIVAGILVFTLKSSLPDLIIGSIVFLLVIQGAIRILKLSK